jgi:hypothetical protein
MNTWPRSRGSLWGSTVLLLGHLCTTAAVFVALFSLGWVVACLLDYLDSIRKFPPESFKLFTRLEIGLVYIDALASGFVLMTGIVRFIRDVLERN